MDNIKKLYLFNFLSNLQFFGAVSVPFFLYWGKLSYTQMFFLQAWFMIWIFLLEIPTGTVADKFGRKKTLFLSAIFGALGLFAYSQIPNFFIFLLAEFLLSVGVALSSGADKAMLYDSLKEMKKIKESKHFFSRYALFGTLALVIAFPLGSIIGGSNIVPYPSSLALTFSLTTIPVLVSALLMLTMKEPKRTKLRTAFLKTGIRSVNYLIKHKILRAFALDMTLISSTTFFIFWFYQPLLLNVGVGIEVLGFVAAGFNILGVLLLSKLKVIEKLFGVKRILFLTALLPSLAYIGLAVYHEIWFTLACIFIIAGFRLFRGPLFDAYMNEYIRSENRATVLSAISMLGRIMAIIFYPIVGFVSDMSIYYALAMLGVIALIFTFFAKVDEKHLKN